MVLKSQINNLASNVLALDKLWLADDESKFQSNFSDFYHFAQFTCKLLNQFNIIIIIIITSHLHLNFPKTCPFVV